MVSPVDKKKYVTYISNKDTEYFVTEVKNGFLLHILLENKENTFLFTCMSYFNYANHYIMEKFEIKLINCQFKDTL